MAIKRTLLGVIIVALWTQSAQAFDCKKVVAALDKCQVPFDFTFGYEQICLKGDLLTEAEINTILRAHDQEMAYNDCAAGVYVEPRYVPGYEK